MNINNSITNRNIFTLFTLKFTLNSVISILHRISGVFLFLLLLLFLFYINYYFLSFKIIVFNFTIMLTTVTGKFFFHICLFVFFFHMLTGFRHILLECIHFKSLYSSKITAFIVIILSLFYFILGGLFYGF